MQFFQTLLSGSEWHAFAVAALLLFANYMGWVPLKPEYFDMIVGGLVGYAMLRLSGKGGTAIVTKINANKETPDA